MSVKYVSSLLLVFGPGLLLFARPALGADPEITKPDPPRPKLSQPVAPAAANKAARGALEARCARCHDQDGTGKKARGDMPEVPDFTSTRWQASRTDGALMMSILDGMGTHMPSYRGKLSEKEVSDMVTQVRAFDPAPARPTPPRTTSRAACAA